MKKLINVSCCFWHKKLPAPKWFEESVVANQNTKENVFVEVEWNQIQELIDVYNLSIQMRKIKDGHYTLFVSNGGFGQQG